jgi:hypothetical protein
LISIALAVIMCDNTIAFQFIQKIPIIHELYLYGSSAEDVFAVDSFDAIRPVVLIYVKVTP